MAMPMNIVKEKGLQRYPLLHLRIRRHPPQALHITHVVPAMPTSIAKEKVHPYLR